MKDSHPDEEDGQIDDNKNHQKYRGGMGEFLGNNAKTK
jgi:hypothetical protein